MLRAMCVLFAFTFGQGARLRSQALVPIEESVEKEVFDLADLFDHKAAFESLTKARNVSTNASQAGSLTAANVSANVSAPVTTKDNPKCDQACTNGGRDRRAKCMVQCKKMQDKICSDKFSCHSGCGNDNKYLKDDPQCEALCNDVHEKICYPLLWEAPKDALSPHHDDKPPPSVEATPAPRIFTGSFMFCNLYASSFTFDVVRLKDMAAKDGETMAKLGYKECQEISMASFEVVGLKAKGKLNAVSKPIDKTPSIMLFGQFAFGNHQIEFNRYFAKGEGPIICNGMPVWEATDHGEKILLYRNEKTLASLRYKECMPTGVKDGDVLKAEIKGKKAGEYKVSENPRVIVLGKAGESGAIAFEAWKNGPETGF